MLDGDASLLVPVPVPYAVCYLYHTIVGTSTGSVLYGKVHVHVVGQRSLQILPMENLWSSIQTGLEQLAIVTGGFSAKQEVCTTHKEGG